MLEKTIGMALAVLLALLYAQKIAPEKLVDLAYEAWLDGLVKAHGDDAGEEALDEAAAWHEAEADGD